MINIPKIKYKASRDIRKIARELNTLSPVEINKIIWKRFRTRRTEASISKWFGEHPDVKEEIRNEIVAKGLRVEEEEFEDVDLSTFSKGIYESIKTVDAFITFCRLKETCSESTLKDYLSALKRFCLGVFPNINPIEQRGFIKGEKRVMRKKYTESELKELRIKGINPYGIDLKEHGWVIRHPNRVLEDDVLEFLALMKRHYPKVDLSGVRIPLRNFLMSKGIMPTRISGKKHKSAGTYSDMYYPIDVIYGIFDYLINKEYEAYVIDNFMFLTATRISATLNARIENLKTEEIGIEREVKVDGVRTVVDYSEEYYITVMDKGTSGSGLRKFSKFLPRQLVEEIKLLTGYPDNDYGNIFSMKDDEMSELNREAYMNVHKDIFRDYPSLDVNHFWRHMFAQHMLRATGWNYGVVARMGGWDTKTLEKNYGKPPIAEVRKWGARFIPLLTRE